MNTISMPHIHYLGDLYRIGGAILNRYHPQVLMEDANAELARELLERSQAVNVVQARVEVENLRTRHGRWVQINQNHLPNFPRLTINYLRDLTVGVYQVSLAPSYVQDGFHNHGQNSFELDTQGNEPGFFRIRVFSRYRNATKYQLWIAYNMDQIEPILGYYCTCKSGARTVGTCAHVASVLWYLGYARHEENIHFPPTSLLVSVLDAAQRPMEE